MMSSVGATILSLTAMTDTPTQTVFRIVPTTQQYDWGKVGLASKVAQLAVSANTTEFSVDHSKSYAEVGVHLICTSNY
jgi:DNA-binding MurR/RpiR family transcriptional regulator